MRTIAVINQKGGVGKTTTVANLGAAVASRGHDTCLIDLDPQSHLTLHLGVEPGAPPVSVYDVLTSGASLRSAAIATAPHLWLIPSVIDLAAAEVELVGAVGREQILRDRLLAHDLPHEFVLIDCPPSLGLLTLNALAAAEEVIIPVQPHFLALQGLGKLLETVSLVQRRINPKLHVSGVIFCMYETATRLAGEVAADLKAFFASARNGATPWGRTRIYQTMVRRNVKLAESPSHGKTIFDYEPNSHGAEDYRKVAEEFLATSAAQAAPATDEQPARAPAPAVTEDAPEQAEQVEQAAGGQAQQEPEQAGNPWPERL